MRVSLVASPPMQAELATALRGAGHRVTTVDAHHSGSCGQALDGADVVVVADADGPDGSQPVRQRSRRRASRCGRAPGSVRVLVAGDDRHARVTVERVLRSVRGNEVVDLGPLAKLRRPGASLPWPRELATQAGLIVGAALLYFAVRGATEGSAAEAVQHGQAVLRFEAALGVDVEAAVQRHVLGHETLTTLANWVYIWGHWPLIAATLVWLHRTARSDFVLLRNAMFISGAIGLVVFATFPVAPPRHLPVGFVDTVTELSRSYRVLQPPQLINEYAAVPSLHVGWNLLVGVVLYRTARHPLVRVIGVVTPLLMAAAVVATANHYVIDGVVGSAIALVALRAAARRYRPEGGRPVSYGAGS